MTGSTFGQWQALVLSAYSKPWISQEIALSSRVGSGNETSDRAYVSNSDPLQSRLCPISTHYSILLILHVFFLMHLLFSIMLTKFHNVYNNSKVVTVLPFSVVVLQIYWKLYVATPPPKKFFFCEQRTWQGYSAVGWTRLQAKEKFRCENRGKWKRLAVTVAVAAGCATEAFQSHLCSAYRGLWGLVVVQLS